MTPELERPQAADASAARSEHARTLAIRALERLERGERNALEEVRETLCAFIAHVRAEGMPREQALEIVRTLVSTPQSPAGGPSLTPAAREALVELSTYWCVAEYGET